MFEWARDAWRARHTSREHAERVAAAFRAPNYEAFESAYGVATPQIVRGLYDLVKRPVPPFRVHAPDGAALEVQGMKPLWADSIRLGARYGWKRLVIGTRAKGDCCWWT